MIVVVGDHSSKIFSLMQEIIKLRPRDGLANGLNDDHYDSVS